MVALLLLFFALLRRCGVRPVVAVLGVALFALAARSRFEPRPQMFNLAAMMLLYGWVFVRKSPLRPMACAVVVFGVVVWVNLHSGAVLFPALIGLYLAAEWTARRAGWGGAHERLVGAGESEDASALADGNLFRILLVAIATALAILCTPNHFRLIPYVLESNAINQGISAEWSSILTFWNDPGNLPLEIPAWGAVVLATAWAIWRAVRRQRGADGASGVMGEVAVVSALLLLPLSSARFVDFCFAPIAFACVEFERFLREKRDRGPVRFAEWFCAASVAVSVVAIGSTVDAAQFRLWVRPAGNFQPVTYPSGAVRFLMESGVDGRLYNIERWGGFVLLQSDGAIPIFIDGRWVTIGERVARDSRVIEQRGDRAFALLDEYGVDVLLVPRGWMTAGIAATHGWVSAFENFNAGIYLRRTNRRDLDRVTAYYAGAGIAFDPARGFDGRSAAAANPQWAHALRVEPRHVVHFRVWGNPIGIMPDQIVRDY